MRRPIGVAFVVLMTILAAGVSATSSARDAIFSDDQTAVGPVVLHEAGVMDGRLVFRVSTGGCTDAASFAVDADRAESLIPDVPHFLLTIRRVRADWCKAFLPEGVEVTLDLGRDVGLTGRFTVAVTNPILPPQRRPDEGVAELRESLLQATLDANRIEAELTSARLQAAEQDGASDETLERLRGRTASIAAERERIVGMDPHDYPLPESGAHEPGVFDERTQYGPVVPALARELVITLTAPIEHGALLEVDGTTRSGPFYRFARASGEDVSRLTRSGRYRVAAYVVYRREYFGFIGDYYVYLTEVRDVSR